MDFEFKLPDLGEGVTEGEVVTWHVNVGEEIQEDQCMVEIMTDKATVTIDSPTSGRVERLTAGSGDVVSVGEVLVVIDTRTHEKSAVTARSTASAVGDLKGRLPGLDALIRAATPSGSGTTVRSAHTVPAGRIAPVDEPSRCAPPTMKRSSSKVSATPATRKLARENNIELEELYATGEDGRVTRKDVLAFLAARQSPGTDTNPTHQKRDPHVADGAVPASDSPSGGPADRRIPFDGLRRKIAERMVRAVHTAAHVTLVESCDATRLLEARERLHPHCEAEGVQLTFLPFVAKAVVRALRRNPALNSSLDVEKGEITQHGTYHIGVAADTAQGLVVPVLRNADRGGLLDLAREVSRLGGAARTGRLTAAELQGSTFTVSSLGKRSGLFATPILNTPNVGILSVHRIHEKPVVRDGKIVVGHELMLALSLDHRIVDGREGAEFLYDVIDGLEEPELLLLS